MPRLPTIRVIGSQAISVSWLLSVVVGISFSTVAIVSPRLLVAGAEFRALGAPLRFLVRRAGGEAAQAADHRAVHAAGGRRHRRAWWLVHEGHELVRESGHGAGDADAADVRAAADAVDPAPLGYVALDDGSPAAELDQALRGTVLGGEVAFLVVPGPVAALVDGGVEQPSRPQRLVERDHRRLPRHLVEQVQDRLGQVVRLDRAARHADNRQARLGLVIPAQVVRYAHGAGRVTRHRVDTAVGGAGSYRQDGRGLGGQPVEPFVGGHRLARRRVVAEAAPVPLGLNVLVRDRPLDDEHKRIKFPPVRLVPPFDEVVRPLLGPALEVDQRPVHRYLGQSRQRAEHDFLDAGLGCGGQRHRVAVAAEAAIHPEYVQDWFLRGLGHSAHPFVGSPADAGARFKVTRAPDGQARAGDAWSPGLLPGSGSRRCIVQPWPARGRPIAKGPRGIAAAGESILTAPQ